MQIIFCELVNSLFGALKFRKIRSLCRCCKLHSITRRTIRFAGAYILGFLLVMISCNIIATTTGHLKPYFAQECPQAFRDCPTQAAGPSTGPSNGPLSGPTASPLAVSNWSTLLPQPSADAPANETDVAPITRPLSEPIQNGSSLTNVSALPLPGHLIRTRRDIASSRGAGLRLVERKWIILEGVNLAELCEFNGDSVQTRRFDRLAMSWPSFPASIVSYACLFLAFYLSFVGTARPFRLLTCVLVAALLLLGLAFDVQLVKEHYSHWEDVLAGSALSLVVVVFVLIVYLNKFRDTHYYERQKLLPSPRSFVSAASEHVLNNHNGYSNEIALEQFNLDKTEDQLANNSAGGQQNGDAGGPLPNNDLSMRYFQIPRANYRR